MDRSLHDNFLELFDCSKGTSGEFFHPPNGLRQGDSLLLSFTSVVSTHTVKCAAGIWVK